jgi:hypothetical protein
MSNHSLYDEDILLWSEQQAAAVRALSRVHRHIPNELDIENVAEEIESVGRSELAAVESHIELILGHLIKLFLERDADAARHWQIELLGFHRQIKRRYSPSMRQRIDMDDIWRLPREQARLAYEGTPRQQAAADLPVHCPLGLDVLLAEEIDSLALVERLRQAAGQSEP